MAGLLMLNRCIYIYLDSGKSLDTGVPECFRANYILGVPSLFLRRVGVRKRVSEELGRGPPNPPLLGGQRLKIDGDKITSCRVVSPMPA
jgi:hypothetical protein